MADLSTTQHPSRPGGKRRISVICPVFNEQQTIPIFHERLQGAISELRSRYDFELIFTDNCSTDSTRDIVKAIQARHPEVELVSLSRNFGYQASLQAGLTYATGDGIVIIDADCEDPPEMIPEFVAKWEEGFDIVYGIRWNRPEAWVIKAARNLFYRILQAVADMDIVLYMAEFSLMSAHVRDATLNTTNSFPFLRSEIGYAGFERCGIRYTRQARVAGKTHYNLARMTMFAGAGILTASTMALRLPLYVLPALMLVNLALLLWPQGSPANTDLAFRLLVTLNLTYLATLASFGCLYLARIYKNGIGRPNFHVNLKRSSLRRRYPSVVIPGRDSAGDLDSAAAERAMSSLLAYEAATRLEMHPIAAEKSVSDRPAPQAVEMAGQLDRANRHR